MPRELSPLAQAHAQELWTQLQMAQRAFQEYVRGCSDQMGLLGNWNLDVATWAFTEVTDEPVD